VILVAVALCLILLAIALLHVAWGLGLPWPAADETQRVATVIGLRGQTRMPGLLPCLAVAGALGAVVAMIGWNTLTASPLTRAGLLAAAAVFLARGVAPWLLVWRRLTPQQPFARLDRLVYGPLCLLLGVGLVFIVLVTPS